MVSTFIDFSVWGLKIDWRSPIRFRVRTLKMVLTQLLDPAHQLGQFGGERPALGRVSQVCCYLGSVIPETGQVVLLDRSHKVLICLDK